MVQFRKSKKIGPFRLTASKSGLSISGGVKGARLSANTKGQVRRTLSVPGTGIYDTKRIGASKAGSRRRDGSGVEHELNLQVIDATRDTRALLSNTPGVTAARVVELAHDAAAIADFTGVAINDQGFRRGIRDAVLAPVGDTVQVIALATIDDHEALFSRKEKRNRANAAPKGKQIGRLNKRSATKLIDQIGNRSVKAVVYIEATPGLPSTIEARWFSEDLNDEQPPTALNATPQQASGSQTAPARTTEAAAPSWYPDPTAPPGHLRYWDGSQWTNWRSDGSGQSWREP